MSNHFKKLRWVVASGAMFLLAACGGGSDSLNGGGGGGGGVFPPGAVTNELSVQVSGQGNVKSQPSGIDCATATCTAVFATTTVVTLTATPGAGQAFTGWGGACSGAQSTCAVTMNEALSVSAAFAVVSGSAGTLYESAVVTASRSQLLSQLNAQGARGFNYYGPLALGGTFFNFYAKDNANTFIAEILDSPTTAASFLTQLNAQGAKGFDFWGPETTGTIFTKESDATALVYELLVSPTTIAGFLNQADAQGDRGFLYVGPYTFGNIYRKVASSSAKYVYRLEPQSATHDALLAQANAQGQEGYKYSGLNVFSGEPVGGFRQIYVKDTSQAAKFEWKNNPPATSAATLIAQADGEGTNGFVYWSLISVDSVIKELYFKPTACVGPLCRATSPL